MKFLVIAGAHRIGKKYGRDDNGNKIVISTGRNVNSGGVVESDENLAERWPEKYRLVSESTPVTPSPDNQHVKNEIVPPNTTGEDDVPEEYQSMTKNQLIQMAAELEIKVPANASKDMLISLLEEASKA